MGLVISNGVFYSHHGLDEPPLDALPLASNDASDMAAAIHGLASPDSTCTVFVHENVKACQMRRAIRTAVGKLQTNGTLFIVLCSHAATCGHGFHFVAGADWSGEASCDQGAVPLSFVLAAVARTIRENKVHNATLVVVVNACRTLARCNNAHAPSLPDLPTEFSTYNCQVITAFSCQKGAAGLVLCALCRSRAL